METRPGLAAPAPSEASPSPPTLPQGALGIPCSSLCPGGWCRVMLGHGDVHGAVGMCHGVWLCHGARLCPLQHVPMHTKFRNTGDFGAIQDPFPALGEGWGHSWDCLPHGWSVPCGSAVLVLQEVAQGLPQVTALGAKPPGEEKYHLQGKGSIGRGTEPLASPSLLPRAIFQPLQMQGYA